MHSKCGCHGNHLVLISPTPTLPCPSINDVVCDDVISRDRKVIHCRIHTKTDEGAAHIKYYTEREIMFDSIYELIKFYQVNELDTVQDQLREGERERGREGGERDNFILIQLAPSAIYSLPSDSSIEELCIPANADSANSTEGQPLD